MGRLQREESAQRLYNAPRVRCVRVPRDPSCAINTEVTHYQRATRVPRLPVPAVNAAACLGLSLRVASIDVSRGLGSGEARF
jgi:hypothetical protein